MKRLENLPDLQKDILKVLAKDKENGLTEAEIKNLVTPLYSTAPTLKDIDENLSKLIEYGSVRGYTNKNNKITEVKYYLSRVLGSGSRNQSKLLGKPNPFRDTYKLFKRIIGAVFALFGVGIIAFDFSSVSGHVIANSSSNSVPGLFLGALGLIALGVALVYRSYK